MTGTVVALLLGAATWLMCRPCPYPAAGAGLGPGSSLESGGRAKNPDFHGTSGGPSSGGPSGISDPALMLDLVAAILVSGRPLPIALRILSEAADPQTARLLAGVVTALELGSDWQGAWELVRSPAALGNEAQEVRAAGYVLRSALAFAASSGAPSAAVLYAQAEQIRRSRAREAERRAAALGIHVVLPLGLCALPAFVCLTVIPLLLALLPSF